MWDGKEPVDEYLAHYGVLGMKWGIKNANYSTVRKKGAAKLEKIDTKSAQSSKIKVKASKLNYKSAKLDYKNLKRRAKGQPEIISKKQQKAAKLNMKAADRWEELFDRRVRDVG